jgi:hypothetical protein
MEVSAFKNQITSSIMDLIFSFDFNLIQPKMLNFIDFIIWIDMD